MKLNFSVLCTAMLTMNFMCNIKYVGILKELNAKLQATITSFGQQIKDKDLELFNVGNNLRTLELQVGSISDDKQTNLDKISSLQDDVTSLTETKEWYQQQLHSAQELR